jgi:hypothetical protein
MSEMQKRFICCLIGATLGVIILFICITLVQVQNEDSKVLAWANQTTEEVMMFINEGEYEQYGYMIEYDPTDGLWDIVAY